MLSHIFKLHRLKDTGYREKCLSTNLKIHGHLNCRWKKMFTSPFQKKKYCGITHQKNSPSRKMSKKKNNFKRNIHCDHSTSIEFAFATSVDKFIQRHEFMLYREVCEWQLIIFVKKFQSHIALIDVAWLFVEFRVHVEKDAIFFLGSARNAFACVTWNNGIQSVWLLSGKMHTLRHFN